MKINSKRDRKAEDLYRRTVRKAKAGTLVLK